MEFKGTQGTWVVDHEERGFNEHRQLCTPISRKYNSYSTIIGLCDVYGEDEESKANALLISKAPEMIEFLIELYNDKESYSGLLPSQQKRLKELIKQATEI